VGSNTLETDTESPRDSIPTASSNPLGRRSFSNFDGRSCNIIPAASEDVEGNLSCVARKLHWMYILSNSARKTLSGGLTSMLSNSQARGWISAFELGVA